uniref:Uncharacterized protein n=1 Tax=Amphimedon queenslandica TaxID=400682 RepID=A0A1X7UFH4_AMPQE
MPSEQPLASLRHKQWSYEIGVLGTTGIVPMSVTRFTYKVCTCI